MWLITKYFDMTGSWTYQNFRLKSKFTLKWDYKASHCIFPTDTSPTMRKASLDEKDTRTVAVSTRYVPKCRQSNSRKTCGRGADICSKGIRVNVHQYTDQHRNSVVSTANIVFPNPACPCSDKSSVSPVESSNCSIKEAAATESSQSLPGHTSNITQTECLSVSDKVTQSTCREIINEIIDRFPSSTNQIVSQKTKSVSQGTVRQKSESVGVISRHSGSCACSCAAMMQPYEGSGAPMMHHYYRSPCSCGRYPGQIYAYIETGYPAPRCMNPICPKYNSKLNLTIYCM